MNITKQLIICQISQQLLYLAITQLCLLLHISVVIGKVLRSIKEGHSYRHKIHVHFYLRYNGCQDPKYLRTPVCPGKQPKWWQQPDSASDDIDCQGPRFIEVIEKCQLVQNATYIISGNGEHIFGNPLSMHLCCAEMPFKPAYQLFQQHLKNRRCCVFDR